MNGQQLEEVSAFKYLGATLTKDSRSTTEIKSRLAIATSIMAKLDKIWKNKNISFPTKMRLYRALVLSTLLYGCESWTITAETTKRVQTFETKCFRRMLGISWSDRKTNDFVRAQVTSRAGPHVSVSEDARYTLFLAYDITPLAGNTDFPCDFQRCSSDSSIEFA